MSKPEGPARTEPAQDPQEPPRYPEPPDPEPPAHRRIPRIPAQRGPGPGPGPGETGIPGIDLSDLPQRSFPHESPPAAARASDPDPVLRWTVPATFTAPEPPPARNPAESDDMPLPSGRVHLTERRRGADLTALGSLVLQLPLAAASLLVVIGLAYAVGAQTRLPVWGLAGAWLLSGVLVFHRRTESLLAQHVFGHRPPSLVEDELLRRVWGDVAARFGTEADAYELWVKESEELNVQATAGHLVSVTSAALRLPPGQLAAVLAHELGRHMAGHSWAALLNFWYGLPARLAWYALRWSYRRAARRSTGVERTGRHLIAAAVVAAVLTVLLLPWLLLLLPLPWLSAALGRRADLRADRAAAVHGFGPHLAAVLQRFITERENEKQREVKGPRWWEPEPENRTRRWPGASLLSPKADLHTRLHRLRPHLPDAPR
ncbi:M48 family metalloprotease [Streptomyces sp. NPDC050504]|uniref:M48 family metalloprotease n=1 Tax=Streptomyces sp. NPDC050504 TaxID=3365618 RepID=UPI0037B5F247